MNFLGLAVLLAIIGLVAYLVIYNWPSADKVSSCSSCGTPPPSPCQKPCRRCGRCKPRCGCGSGDN